MKSTNASVSNGAAEKTRSLDTILSIYRSMPYPEYLQTPHWQMVRERALLRANNKCQLCASTDHLEAHHNTYERRGCEEPEDVVVLCHECHSKHHTCEEKSSFPIGGVVRPLYCILPHNHKSPHRISENIWWVVRDGRTIMLTYRDVE